MLLKDETAFYKVCFNSMQVGILVFDSNKIIVMVNNPVAEIFGYNKNVLLGNNIDILFKSSEMIERFIENSVFEEFKSTKELIGIKKNKKEVFLELSFGKMKYEGEFYYKVLISDISKRKQKEVKISHLNVKLKEEVKLSNNELNRVIDQLKIALTKEKELNNLKTRFIALASHEFKTPLSAILSSTELMAKYCELQDIEKRNEHLEKVKIMISRLTRMLDDLLTLENIEAGNISPKFETFNFKELTNEILQNTKYLLKNNQSLEINNISEENIYYDRNIMNIILTNLLNNAVKYSEENSNIKVEIHTNESTIFFKVNDDGIGIPKNEQNLIFKRFFRAKNAIYYPGTGIGLNIVKGYVDSLNGKISFKSIQNEGTVFKVQLPKINNHEEKGIIN